MKRKAAAGMAAVMALSACLAAGCGGEKQNGTEAPQQQGQQGQQSQTGGSGVFNGELEHDVVIQALENDTAIEQKYFDELIRAFNEAYRDYGITAVDANMDQYLDLANDGPYGFGPDVLYQANDVIMKYVEGKHVYPIPVEQLECYDKIPEAAWKAYETEVDGEVYT